MATSRVLPPPSVDEVIRRLGGDFDTLTEAPAALTEAPAAATEAPAAATEAPAAAMEAPAAPTNVPDTPREAPDAIAAPAAEPDAFAPEPDTEVEALRGSSQRAVERLVRGSTSLMSETARAAGDQHEVEQQVQGVAADMLTDAAAQAQRVIDVALAEHKSLLDAARAEARALVIDGETERDAIIAHAEAQARAIIAHADVELGRRVRRITELTDGIIDIAETAAGRLAAGALTGAQLAQFIAALTTVTERALERIGPVGATGVAAGSAASEQRGLSLSRQRVGADA